ncbi:MAG: exodeoxyribonuclease VII large subunit [Tenericutes bacterium GWC2_34_14]|nr:MAG: exodeoxyribonuclease VII large subunit [Tenericutes bacterium GWA2_35_7]OHE29318.1 MAG: exodeoxyribonuclease VII large subunit [Tenericutes bacterium GWC2_34_14]OHE34415.1 MAG: exodeoxyribonuclease VII large subunit [Tenericutes bacterium GWE2_34_108]OHE35771.1 MAG: exodeoxyribonuclease VII large subunit [Tenericutes bacterium GWF1_35_14]OHE39142.1 MAG: exodeoxyribonuclease VII large subunit [Tenericutes bacterium GWF2_35_184]OHE42373.1 MAG: exodeoxyribonuclease VII large subunit [Tene
MIQLDEKTSTVERAYLTVTALTKYIKMKLEGDKHLVSILIKGEISNFKRHSRGHLYFTLKDENASISAIMFSRDADKLLFTPKEGDHVLIQGRISLYEPSGTYSIQVSTMSLDGIGELYQKYEALKKELEEKGYFRLEHKKKIPLFPKVIGVITSPTGAVIQDIINTVTRRYPLVEVHLYSALVQGPGSADSIRNQILYANQLKTADVLIVGRGGGSIEDLWSFNEMPVIDAIYQSEIPVITAIGHETDFTISDFVSDLRAPTPTAAAELATPNKIDLILKLKEYDEQMLYRLSQVFSSRKTELLYLDQRLDRLSPEHKLDQLHETLNRYRDDLNKNILNLFESKKYLVSKLTDTMKSPVDRLRRYDEMNGQLLIRLHKGYQSLMDVKTSRFDLYRAKLETLNPLSVMDKGFAVISKDKKVLTSVKELNVDDHIELRLKDGRAIAEIKEIKGE